MLRYQIIRAEIRRFFGEPRSLIALPIVCASAVFALWPYMPHWAIPVVMGTFVIIEPTFSNILFRSPREFEALAIAPVPWVSVVLSKNFAAMILAFCVAVFVAVPTVYFLPEPPSGKQAQECVAILATVLFPMLMAGNTRSVKSPRRHTGLTLEDVAEAIITVVNVGAASLPYLLIMNLFDQGWPVILYVLGVGAIWFVKSVPATAKKIEQNRTALSLTI